MPMQITEPHTCPSPPEPSVEFYAFIRGERDSITRDDLIAVLRIARRFGDERRDGGIWEADAATWAYLVGYLQLVDEVEQ
jgi:hypothetical protein